jgi:hypothetical protein
MKIPAENIQTRFFENIYKQSVESIPKPIQFAGLSNGIKILENEEECDRYIALYAGHHFHKLRAAFVSTNFAHLNGRNVEIIDWGCGQATATCILFDYLIENRIVADIEKITLIDPSEIALSRGAKFILQMFQNNQEANFLVRTICKNIDSLTKDDFETDSDNIKVHLFSNIIDVEAFNLNSLYGLIVNVFKTINRLICTSPGNSRTHRLDEFYGLFSKNHQLVNVFASNEEIRGEIYKATRRQYINDTITRYEKQFTVDLPPF